MLHIILIQLFAGDIAFDNAEYYTKYLNVLSWYMIKLNCASRKIRNTNILATWQLWNNMSLFKIKEKLKIQ